MTADPRARNNLVTPDGARARRATAMMSRGRQLSRCSSAPPPTSIYRETYLDFTGRVTKAPKGSQTIRKEREIAHLVKAAEEERLRDDLFPHNSCYRDGFCQNWSRGQRQAARGFRRDVVVSVEDLLSGRDVEEAQAAARTLRLALERAKLDRWRFGLGSRPPSANNGPSSRQNGGPRSYLRDQQEGGPPLAGYAPQQPRMAAPRKEITLREAGDWGAAGGLRGGRPQSAPKSLSFTGASDPSGERRQHRRKSSASKGTTKKAMTENIVEGATVRTGDEKKGNKSDLAGASSTPGTSLAASDDRGGLQYLTKSSKVLVMRGAPVTCASRHIG